MVKKQNKSSLLWLSSRLKRKTFLLTTVGIGLTLVCTPALVRAVQCSTVSDCSQQAQTLQQQNAQSQQNLNQLQIQASSYQDAINKLQAQIDGLQQQIDINSATQASLQAQIKADQQQLDTEKLQLGADVKAMYVGGQMSTIEELATSKDLSDFVDAETYRSAVQSKIQVTLAQITALQDALKAQEAQVAALLASQQTQQNQLNSDQAQQAQLLSYNQGQQDQYNQQIQANVGQIQQLQAKIAELNAPAGSNFTVTGSCGGGYPASATGPYGNWGCNYAKDNTIDVWGMDNRECVSYTAFMVHEDYLAGINSHDMPNWGGVGNAGEWIADAQNAGIPVDQSPGVHDIAIRPASGLGGDVGHAMYVADVGTSANGHAGQIFVQQYNADLLGNYSYGWRSAAGLYFIHFSRW